MSSLLINKIPLWRGQTQRGVRLAPEMLTRLIWNIHYNTDKDDNYNQLIISGISDENINNTDNIQETIYYEGMELMKYYQEGDLLVNLAGDHAISMGTVPLMVCKYPNLKVVWVDAHTDIHSPETSLSGNCHGMPAYFMSELSGASFYNKLKLKNLCYYGIRDLDPAEEELVINKGIKNYTTDEIKSDRDDIIDEIDKWVGYSPIHLSIDVDALDPASFPSTGVRAGNGLSLDDITLLCERIKAKNLVSMDLVEFNPEIGSEKDVLNSLHQAGSILERLI